MLTKKEFADAMTAIIEQNAEDNRISRMLGSICCDSCFFDTKYATRGLLELLKSAMKDHYGWIEYWLYELDRGRKWTENSITDNVNMPIKLQSISDLYVLLKKEYKDKK